MATIHDLNIVVDLDDPNAFALLENFLQGKVDSRAVNGLRNIINELYTKWGFTTLRVTHASLVQERMSDLKDKLWFPITFGAMWEMMVCRKEELLPPPEITSEDLNILASELVI